MIYKIATSKNNNYEALLEELDILVGKDFFIFDKPIK